MSNSNILDNINKQLLYADYEKYACEINFQCFHFRGFVSEALQSSLVLYDFDLTLKFNDISNNSIKIF